MSKEDGGPAFPHKVPQGMGAGGPVNRSYPGISQRDYFAGQAMIGFMSELGNSLASDDKPDRAARAIAHTARLSYMVADAMLKERERG